MKKQLFTLLLAITSSWAVAFSPATTIVENEIYANYTTAVDDTYFPITFYVDVDNGSDSNDGKTWSNSFKTIQAALNLAQVFVTDTILIANGTYYPTDGAGRTISFHIKENAALYAGFVGGVNSVEGVKDADPATNVTILSGDIGVLGDSTDNSYHVIYSTIMSNATIISGVTISGGYADGGGEKSRGGGVYNKTDGINASPTFVTCTISGNTASSSSSYDSYGGGVYNYACSGNSTVTASPVFENCTIEGNTASSSYSYSSSSYGGGGI
jgi:hypothetical protein